MFYSKSTNGFFSEDIHGSRRIIIEDIEIDNTACNIPSDAVEITEEHWHELLNGQSNGKVISFDNDGIPILKDVPPPTAEQLLLDIFAQRSALLNIAAKFMAPLQDAADLGISTSEETSSLIAWKQYRVALNRIEQQKKFPQSIVWPVLPN